MPPDGKNNISKTAAPPPLAKYECYNDLISLIIERNYQFYASSPEPNKLQYRFIRFGLNYSIDLEQKIEFHTKFTDRKRRLKRNTAERKRSKKSVRFIDPTPFQIQGKELGQYHKNSDYAWLSKAWYKKNIIKNPSKKDIMCGILEEVVCLFEERSGSSTSQSDANEK